jgi:hypothetical protein
MTMGIALVASFAAPDRDRASHDEEVHRELHQLAGQCGQPVELAVGESLLDYEVLALDVPQLAQSQG